jgi:hypothetical protein
MRFAACSAGRSPRSPAGLIALRAELTLTQSEYSTYKKCLDKVDVVLVNSAMLAQTSRPSLFLPITSLQLQHYHGITHSFAQRQPSIPPIFSSFRTLSIATGVVPLPQLRRGYPLCGLPYSDLSVLCVALFLHLPVCAITCATWRLYPPWNQSIPHTSCHHGRAPRPSRRNSASTLRLCVILCLCFHILTKLLAGNSFPFTFIQNPRGGALKNPPIFSVRQLSDTILSLCLRRQPANTPSGSPAGSQSTHERCNRDA